MVFNVLYVERCTVYSVQCTVVAMLQESTHYTVQYEVHALPPLEKELRGHVRSMARAVT